MFLITYSLRELLRRPARSLLTVIGIAIGVATVIASATAIHAARIGCTDLFDDISGPRSLDVTAASRAGFDGRIAAELGKLPGIRAAVPRVQSAAALLGCSGPVPTVVLGVDFDRVQANEQLHVLDGRGLRANGEVLIDAAFAEMNGLTLGEKVSLWGPARRVELVLVGRLRPSMSSVTHHVQAVVSLATAQKLFALPGQVNEIQCLLTENANPDTVLAEVRRRLPVGLTVQSPASRVDSTEATRAVVEQGLAGLSGMSLVASVFVVLNTFLMNLGERQQEIALLRSLGATMRQVRRLLLCQAALLGTAGALLGCGMGVVLGLLLLHIMGAFLGFPLHPEAPSLGTFLLALALGIGTALAATALPARNAAARPILELWRQTGGGRSEYLSWRVSLLGIVLLIVAGGSIAAVWGGWSPSWLGVCLLPTAVACLLVGTVSTAAPLFPRFLALSGLLPRQLMGIEANLALQQLQRRPVRTALTAGVLVVVVVMSMGFGHVLLSSLGVLRQWCRRTIPADFLVQSSLPDTAFLLATALPEELADELHALPGVSRVARISFLPAQVNGTSVLVLARTFDRTESLPLDLHDGRPETVREGLLRGEVVVGSGLSHTLGLHPGDSLRLETSRGPQPLRIVGTATEFVGGGQALYLEWNTAKTLLHFSGAHILLVTAAPGQVEPVSQRLRSFCTQRHLLMQTNQQLRGQIDALFGRVTAAFWALIALAFLIASVGVLNTLSMNVREQARELAVLRALGMTRASLRRLILWQAAFLSFVSLVPGAVIGLGLGWILTRSANLSLDQRGPWAVGPLLFLGCGALVFTATLLMALISARSVLRVAAPQTM